MLYIIIFLALFFIAMAYLITPKNANTLLAGYNTLSNDDKDRVDIIAVLKYYKKFHIFLGVSMLVLGVFIYYVIGKDVAGIFLGVYPILAYIYFAIKSKNIFSGLNNKSTKVGIIVLIITLIGVSLLFINGIKDNKLRLNKQEIIIDGNYGETIKFSEIKNIELVDTLPKISFKSNGFALEIIKKGYFRTKSGETIKLLINSKKRPFILITKTDDKKIYYVSKSEDNKTIYNRIKDSFVISEK
jgi:hypothetical protein